MLNAGIRQLHQLLRALHKDSIANRRCTVRALSNYPTHSHCRSRNKYFKWSIYNWCIPFRLTRGFVNWMLPMSRDIHDVSAQWKSKPVDVSCSQVFFKILTLTLRDLDVSGFTALDHMANPRVFRIHRYRVLTVFFFQPVRISILSQRRPVVVNLEKSISAIFTGDSMVCRGHVGHFT